MPYYVYSLACLAILVAVRLYASKIIGTELAALPGLQPHINKMKSGLL